MTSIDLVLPLILLCFGSHLTYKAFLITFKPLFDSMDLSAWWIGRRLARVEGKLSGSEFKPGVKIAWLELFITQPTSIGMIGRIDRDVIEKIYRLNLKTIEKMIESYSTYREQLELISKLPDLIEERRALMFSAKEAIRAKKNIKKRRATKGKDTPTWAFSEFDKKLSALKSDLRGNQQSIKATLLAIEKVGKRRPDNHKDSIIH